MYYIRIFIYTIVVNFVEKDVKSKIKLSRSVLVIKAEMRYNYSGGYGRDIYSDRITQNGSLQYR